MRHLGWFGKVVTLVLMTGLVLAPYCRADGMPDDDQPGQIKNGKAPATTSGQIGVSQKKGAGNSDVIASVQPKSPDSDDSQAMLSLDKASPEKMAEAIGHYARTRSLLVAAIREWDKGVTTAAPDGILNSEAWRSKLESLAHDLEIILDPQPRVTRGGVKYEADTRLLNVTRK